MTLALTGSSQGETEPRKATYPGAGRNIKTLTTLHKIPPHRKGNSGKSPGNPIVEMTTPNGTINLSEGTNKNDL
ncbi:MAG: hypothetical protein V7K88_03430 [Nostoc sp.]